MSQIIVAIHALNDFCIIAASTIMCVLCGLAMYNILRLICSPLKFNAESYYGVTIIGTAVSLNAVLLIFVLVQEIDAFKSAHKAVTSEVESLHMIDLSTIFLSAQQSAPINKNMSAYVVSILDSDWPKPTEDITEPAFRKMILSIMDVFQEAHTDTSARQQLFSAVQHAMNARYDRVLYSGKGIPISYFKATVLLLTALVVFFYLLAPKKLFSQVALSLLMSFLGILLGLVIVYNNPYWVEDGVTKEDFRPALESLLKN